MDQVTIGLKDSDLIIVAGRPSMGKTSLGLNIALNIINQQYNGICIFSLEMPKNQILYKLLSIGCKIPLQKIISNKISNSEWEKIQKLGKRLIESKLHIDDTANLSINTLKLKASTINDISRINLIIIDYLQLIQVNENTLFKRSEELSIITRSLKILAKELNIPIIILSQLNRNVESRINKRPILSDLRESGCLKFNTKIIRKQNLPNYYIYKQKINHIKITHIQYSYKLSNYTSKIIELTHNHCLLSKHGWQKNDQLKYFSRISYQEKSSSKIKNFQVIKNININNKFKMYDIEIHETKYLNTNNMIYTHNSIEQDADLVLFLYRDSYYNEHTNNRDLTEIIVAKHRNGPIGTAELKFNSEIASFTNIEE